MRAAPPDPPPLQLGRNALKPVLAGEVRVHWILPEDSERAAEDPLYQAPYRRAVEESMQAVVAALQQEAEAKGFGKHVLVRRTRS